MNNQNLNTFNLALLCIFIALPVLFFAQTRKGTKLVEGNIGNLSFSTNRKPILTTDESPKEKHFYIDFTTRIGWFLNERFVLGTSVDLSVQRYRLNTSSSGGGFYFNSKESTTLFGLTPFSRYYFSSTSKTQFYGQIGFGSSFMRQEESSELLFQSSNTVYDSDYSKRTYLNFSGELLFGMNHFIHPNVAFNTAIGPGVFDAYKLSTETSNYSGFVSSSNKLEILERYVNLNWNFGFTFFFGKQIKN